MTQVKLLYATLAHGKWVTLGETLWRSQKPLTLMLMDS